MLQLKALCIDGVTPAGSADSKARSSSIKSAAAGSRGAHWPISISISSSSQSAMRLPRPWKARKPASPGWTGLSCWMGTGPTPARWTRRMSHCGVRITVRPLAAGYTSAACSGALGAGGGRREGTGCQRHTSCRPRHQRACLPAVRWMPELLTVAATVSHHSLGIPCLSHRSLGTPLLGPFPVRQWRTCKEVVGVPHQYPQHVGGHVCRMVAHPERQE